jgi:hypothetical protein
MKTIQQLQAEQAQALAALTREHEIANAMPVPPHAAMLCGKRAPWITYKVANLRDALSVFDSFASRARIVNMEHTRGTFTHLCPPSDVSSERNPPEHQGDYCIALSVDEGEGFGPNVDLMFYAETSAGLCRVYCKLEPASGPARWHNFRAQQVVERDRRTERILSRAYTPNAALNGYADHVLRYASGDMGPVKTAAHMVYAFVADDGQACTVFDHARAQLTTLAQELGAWGE